MSDLELSSILLKQSPTDGGVEADLSYGFQALSTNSLYEKLGLYLWDKKLYVAKTDGSAFAASKLSTDFIKLHDNVDIDPVKKLTKKATLRVGTSGHHGEAAAAANDKLYIATDEFGVIEDRSIYEYNPTTNTWTRKRSGPVVEKGAGASVNNKVYFFHHRGNVYEYNPSNNTITTKKSLKVEPGEYSGAVSYNNKIYVIGGELWDHYLSFKNTVNIFDASNNTTTTGASMSHARNRMGAALHDGKIYVFGGITRGTYKSGSIYPKDLKVNEVYDIATNTWSTKKDIPVAGRVYFSGTIGGAIYAILKDKKIYKYRPKLDSWEVVFSGSTHVDTGETGAVIKDKFYYNNYRGETYEYNPGVSYDELLDNFKLKDFFYDTGINVNVALNKLSILKDNFVRMGLYFHNNNIYLAKANGKFDPKDLTKFQLLHSNVDITITDTDYTIDKMVMKEHPADPGMTINLENQRVFKDLTNGDSFNELGQYHYNNKLYIAKVSGTFNSSDLTPFIELHTIS